MATITKARGRRAWAEGSPALSATTDAKTGNFKAATLSIPATDHTLRTDKETRFFVDLSAAEAVEFALAVAGWYGPGAILLGDKRTRGQRLRDMADALDAEDAAR